MRDIPITQMPEFYKRKVTIIFRDPQGLYFLFLFYF